MTSTNYQLKMPAIKRVCFEMNCRTQAILDWAKKNDKKRAKKENNAWKGRKEEMRHEIGLKRDDLQTEINRIVLLIDINKPCTARPEWQAFRYDAGHVFGRKAWPSLKYHLNNIYKQCRASNGELGGEQLLMLEGIEREHGVKEREITEGLTSKYPILKLPKDKYDYAKKMARKIIREWDKNPMTREEVNIELGIYK